MAAVISVRGAMSCAATTTFVSEPPLLAAGLSSPSFARRATNTRTPVTAARTAVISSPIRLLPPIAKGVARAMVFLRRVNDESVFVNGRGRRCRGSLDQPHDLEQRARREVHLASRAARRALGRVELLEGSRKVNEEPAENHALVSFVGGVSLALPVAPGRSLAA